MKTHRVKSWPEFYGPVADGSKPFELRRNDRDYQVGDILLLCEWNPNDAVFTGNEVQCRITYVLEGVGTQGAIAPLLGLNRGYCILGLASGVRTL